MSYSNGIDLPVPRLTVWPGYDEFRHSPPPVFPPRAALLSTPRSQKASLTGTWLNALANDRLALHAQSITSLQTEQARDERWYELLLRLRGDDEAVLSPRDFIPIAERYGLMPAIDRWVVDASLRWLATHAQDPTLRLSINLSATSIERADMLRHILSRLDRSDIDPMRVCFEITETAAINDLQQAALSIRDLKDRGCLVALDDFGKGSASLSYLRYMNFNFLKLDAGFICNMHDSPKDFMLVKAMTVMARELGVRTIAEGVEDMAVVEPLKRVGVDYAQGYALGAVIDLSEI